MEWFAWDLTACSRVNENPILSRRVAACLDIKSSVLPPDKTVWKNSSCSVVYILHIIYVMYYLAIKKEQDLAIAKTWMNFEGVMLSEMSDRERQIPYDLSYT